LQKLHLFDDTIPMITSVEGVVKVLVLYHLGLLPFLSLPEAVFGITLEKVLCAIAYIEGMLGIRGN
jgi:hypothetical protein